MKFLKQNDTLVIIPVFNEEKSIGKVIDDLFSENIEADILVINDGSFDKTSKVLEEKKVFALNHIYNIGIGASFESGCQFALNARYDYVIRMDGDGQHSVCFLKDILKPLKDNEADIVIGSRFLGYSSFKTSFPRSIGIAIIASFLRILTKRKITDPTSGFYAMNRRAFEFFSKRCAEDYPEPEMIMHHRNFNITEVPIAMAKRYSGVSSITPLKSIYYMVKVLFSLLVRNFKGGEK